MPEPFAEGAPPPGGPSPPSPPGIGDPGGGAPDPSDPGPPIPVTLGTVLLGDLGHSRVDSRLLAAILLRDGCVAGWLRERGVTADAVERDFPGSRRN